MINQVRRIDARPGCAGYEVEGARDQDLGRAVYRLAREAGWELSEMSLVKRDLETVFRELVLAHDTQERAAGKKATAEVRSIEEARA